MAVPLGAEIVVVGIIFFTDRPTFRYCVKYVYIYSKIHGSSGPYGSEKKKKIEKGRRSEVGHWSQQIVREGCVREVRTFLTLQLI